MPSCFLLGFATVITTVALLIVEANQEQGLSWDLASYTLAYMALFGAAHLTIRRFAPYADPLLLPVVALLNGLGLVMIHRLDLAAGDVTAGGCAAQRQPADAVDPRRGRRVLVGRRLPARPSNPGPLRLRLRCRRV